MKSTGLLDEPASELRDRRIAVKLGLTLREAEEVRRRLREVQLVGEDWQPVAWERRQYKHDSSAERVRQFRERQRNAMQGSESIGNGYETVTVTSTDTDTEPDTESDTKEAPKRKPATFDPYDTPEGINPQAWAGWVDYRRQRKKPISAAAARLQWAGLANLTYEQQVQCIAKSIANDWTGLFPENWNNAGAPSHETRRRPDTSAAGEIRNNVARARAARASAATDGNALADDGLAFRPPVGEQFRPGD